MTFSFTPIGVLRSCFREKFGIPRQPGLAPAAEAVLEILPPFDRDEAFRGLDDFSHLWLVVVFHATAAKGWRPTVRPPRLGGNRRVGVFATRSGFRPNPIGLSAVRFHGIRRDHGVLGLRLSGVDLLDGTPVLDVKPYLPWADSLPDAHGAFAHQPPATSLAVEFSYRAEEALRTRPDDDPLRELVVQVLAADPRPAYRDGETDDRPFGIRLLDVDVRWRIVGGRVHVMDIQPMENAAGEIRGPDDVPPIS